MKPIVIKFGCSLLCILAMASVASACNIPVFRYALERWQPDACEVIVFHDGMLSKDQQRQLQSLRRETSKGDEGNADKGGGHANAKVILSDVSRSDSPHRELWESISEDASPPKSVRSLPYAVARMKLGPGRVIVGWQGPLDSLEDAGIFDSPARRELSRRLLLGDSVVWLMIASGDEARNQEIRQRLKDNFKTLADKIELPEGIGLPGSELHSEIPLLLQFSLLEIKPNDPAEAFLVKLLSGFQPKAVAEGEPLIVPVFGRGRALEVIPADTLSVRLLEDLTAFLSGACSCQVKEQNPGFDLLLSVDWNTELFGEGSQPPPPRTTRDRVQPIRLAIPPGK